ncbi:uncharacterized protein LOC131931277 [Physella acuta]|uniref:uncharacterized protein LOC131931277 n=1 Tax=Physella acuta TaxID=109671 RepID=UPI0027DB00E8|nr:uncharacterized protein LOC131931277 [Physella acuta]
MAFVKSFKDSSLLLKVTACILIINMALAWVSFVTASWGDGYGDDATKTKKIKKGYGLWKECSDDEIESGCVNLTGWNLQWYRAVQAFSIFGFMSVNFCFLSVLLLMFNPSCHKRKSLHLWVAVIGLWSAISYTVSIIVFGVGFDSSFTDSSLPNQYLEYGWALAIVVAVFQVFVGLIMIIESRSIDAKFMDL